MSEPTFRDFAGAAMRGDVTAAASVLETLLALDGPSSVAAAEHFRSHMADPAFMQQAMGLRTAVGTGSDAEIGSLLARCFGLTEPALTASVSALRARYPKP